MGASLSKRRSLRKGLHSDMAHPYRVLLTMKNAVNAFSSAEPQGQSGYRDVISREHTSPFLRAFRHEVPRRAESHQYSYR